MHDFIHNRVLFKLRHRVGAKILERETNPDKLKELTLCAALLARVGYVDENFLPQEKQFIQKLLREVWGISSSLAEAVCGVAMEAANRGLDLFRLIQETKATLSVNKRKTLLEALFALALAEGKMTGEEIEEIRKIAYFGAGPFSLDAPTTDAYRGTWTLLVPDHPDRPGSGVLLRRRPGRPGRTGAGRHSFS